MKTAIKHLLLAVTTGIAVGCASVASYQNHQPLVLPQQLVGKAVVLEASDTEYSRAVFSSAKRDPGKGGISDGLVVKTTADMNVYRLWNGPDKLDAQGFTNRLGPWWSYDAPTGSDAAYRARYEICKIWNDLTWAVTCTLKKGAVVAIGPGQSVSAETCEDPTGKEHYSANWSSWQVYIDSPWKRTEELQCPPSDYQVEPSDISRPKIGTAPKSTP
jgi:hypothetical protein